MDNVKLKIAHNFIQIKSHNGVLKKFKSKNFIIYNNNNMIYFFNQNKTTLNFYYNIIKNYIWGLNKGFIVYLKIVGLGYKATLNNEKKILSFDLGFSHQKHYELKNDIKVQLKGPRSNIIFFYGPLYHELKNNCFLIKKFKKKDSYKGKGIYYINEKIKLKEGKKLNV